MTNQDIKNDIDYLRELAEAGEKAPSIGGRFALWWGLAATLVMVIHWAIIRGHLPVGADMLWLLWLGFIVIGSLGSAVLGMSVRNKPGLGSAGNRVESAVWQGTGLSTFTYFLAVTAGVLFTQLPPVFFNTILSVALLGYGAAWITTAMMSRTRWRAVTGVAAFFGAALTVVFVNSPEVYLIAAGTILVTTVLPGVMMMRSEPRDTV